MQMVWYQYIAGTLLMYCLKHTAQTNVHRLNLVFHTSLELKTKNAYSFHQLGDVQQDGQRMVKHTLRIPMNLRPLNYQIMFVGLNVWVCTVNLKNCPRIIKLVTHILPSNDNEFLCFRFQNAKTYLANGENQTTAQLHSFKKIVLVQYQVA